MLPCTTEPATGNGAERLLDELACGAYPAALPLETVKEAVKLVVTLAESTTCTVIECVPLVTDVDAQGLAVEVLPPRKSNGAAVSTCLGSPTRCGSSSQNDTLAMPALGVVKM